MKKLLISILLLFFIQSILSAQSIISTNDFTTNYLPVKPKGTIPNDLCNLFTEAYMSEKGDLDKTKNTRKEKIVKEKYLQESNFFINQILLSGIVLYNTPINEYVDKIMDKILVNEPELRKNIRIYILKTPSVNASATDKGIMFVNLGLIAQSGSESQLAYILSHELIHYLKKHNIELYLEKDKLVRNNSGLKSNSAKETLYKTHFRSREMENEADEIGFNEYFLKTNYDLNQALETYDVLQYAYLPFDEIPFDLKFLTDSMFTFPEKYIPETLNPIKARDDYDDEASTHPNIKKRREMLSVMLGNQINNNRIINPLGNDYFKSIRDMARFECLRLYVIEQNFTLSFYNAWIMKKDYPDNKYLDQIISASLYGISKYKRNGNIYDIIPNSKKVEGEIHMITSLFKNIKTNEINAIALRYIIKACLKYPDDKYLAEIKNDLLVDLIITHNASINDFNNNSMLLPKIDSVITPNESIQKQSSKIRNIEKKKKSQKSNDFYHYVFAGLVNNPTLIKDFKKAAETVEEIKKSKKPIIKNKRERIKVVEREEESSDNNGEINFEEETDPIKYSENHGAKLGIDKLLIYNPFYIKFDFRKDQNFRFFDTEKSQLDFITLLKNNAKRTELNVDIITTNNLKTEGTDLYNKHLLLNDWTDEFSNWDVNGRKVLFLSQDIKDIISTHDTKYINITGVISAKANQLDGRTFSYVLYSALSPVMWPLTMQYFFRPAFHTVYYNMVIDMETGKMVFTNNAVIDMSDSKSFLNSRIYDSYNQIKTKD